MTFIWRDMLWLLLALPVLVGVYILIQYRRSRAPIRHPRLAFVYRAMDQGVGFRRHIPPFLLLVSLGLLILAMARPAMVMTLASQRGTIVMAIDVSGSMRAADIAPNRISAAQISAKAFVKDHPRNVRIGIVAFSGEAFPVQTPTTDIDDLDAAIDSLRPERMTAIGAALVTSLQTIFPGANFDSEVPGYGGDQFAAGAALNEPSNPPARPPALKTVEPGSYRTAAIILMTDGKNTSGPDPIAVARIAADLGVRVFTIGFGTPNGQMISLSGYAIRAVLDEATLKTIADITRGQYFHAQSSTELTAIYKNLNTKLQSETQTTEVTAFFMAAACVFAALSALLSTWWFNRIF